MSEDELRAAAEMVVATGMNKDWADTIDAGALAVCRAWLAEHPADDQLEPTVDRLRAAGFEVYNDGLRYQYGSDAVAVCYFPAMTNQWKIATGWQSVFLPPLSTMAAVRAWQRAVDAANQIAVMPSCPQCGGTGMVDAPPGDTARKWPCDNCYMNAANAEGGAG